ncbi:uncharacterized protein LOC129595083 [Paramacrobiotus metropolitanus]|uniref:uncharacterized protein LOC129595083 n=1 Tax=Paramacrobiotus metropolitanus TaxID=2943436 RepID=UPI0024464CAC|nr:uncharacterized protein LOC129595083 [Paramacrobiotus metropolitanus]
MPTVTFPKKPNAPTERVVHALDSFLELIALLRQHKAEELPWILKPSHTHGEDFYVAIIKKAAVDSASKLSKLHLTICFEMLERQPGVIKDHPVKYPGRKGFDERYYQQRSFYVPHALFNSAQLAKLAGRSKKIEIGGPEDQPPAAGVADLDDLQSSAIPVEGAFCPALSSTFLGDGEQNPGNINGAVDIAPEAVMPLPDLQTDETMVLGTSAKETEPDTSDDEGIDGIASATLHNSDADNDANRKSDTVKLCTSQPSLPILGTDNPSGEGNGAEGVDPILEALKPIISSNNNLPKTAVALGERFAILSGELLQDACAKCYEKIPQLGCPSEATAASSSLSKFFSCSTSGLHFHGPALTFHQ